nr:uncharacterized protein KIAA1841 homolog [Onthophagus taurus]
METAIVTEKRPLKGKLSLNKSPKSETSEITVKEFLDFLKTAYQVQENIEGILKNEGHTEIVDWLELKQNNLIKPKDIAIQTSDIKVNATEKKQPLQYFEICNNESVEIKRKLSEILSEGIFDSVLSFLVPQNISNIQRRSSIAKMQGCSVNFNQEFEKNPEKLSKSKSMDTLSLTSKLILTPIKADSEVEIHVHDEIKNVKKDFVCNQKLLVQQMGYFADVTAGQKLEDMDISVHCDIGIFEWLMNWVKNDKDKPKLDANCAVPVLVSAAFLQMEPLTDECLRFCHENMNEILRSNTSMSCLNDTVLSRLAAMYTNAEVEDIKDRKDKIQSKLYCKLIQAICEPEAESLRGHFCTMGRVYKCK